jgi:putative hydrolase of the HAD superfamily
MGYRNIFFDLDDTLWDHTANARDTFEAMYHEHRLSRYFDSFAHFYSLYLKRNDELWEEYGRGEVTKEELNDQRFAYPLLSVGVDDPELVRRYREGFFAVIHTKGGVKPHTHELLDYLAPNYNLYILSNGFRELQSRKMESAGIAHYFRRVILSEDIGVLKPNVQLFNFALSATQSQASQSLMVGDNWSTDIVGAYNAGLAQAYYDVGKPTGERAFKPTYEVKDLIELKAVL